MLIDLIKQHAITEAQDGNWAKVAEILNGLQHTIQDPTQWSFGLMMSQAQLPTELVAGVAGAIQSAGLTNPLMASAFIALSTTGLQLHTSDRQAMIDEIGAGMPTEAVAAIKSLGIRSVPVTLTTLEECQSAWLADQARQVYEAIRNRRDAWDTLSAQIRSGIESGSLVDNASVVSAVSSAMGA